MPADPLQLTLAVLEYIVVFSGAGLVLWLLFNRRQRSRWLGVHTLPQISLSGSEFALAAALIFLTGVASSSLAQLALARSASVATGFPPTTCARTPPAKIPPMDPRHLTSVGKRRAWTAATCPERIPTQH